MNAFGHCLFHEYQKKLVFDCLTCTQHMTKRRTSYLAPKSDRGVTPVVVVVVYFHKLQQVFITILHNAWNQILGASGMHYIMASSESLYITNLLAIKLSIQLFTIIYNYLPVLS